MFCAHVVVEKVFWWSQDEVTEIRKNTNVFLDGFEIATVACTAEGYRPSAGLCGTVALATSNKNR